MKKLLSNRTLIKITLAIWLIFCSTYAQQLWEEINEKITIKQ